MYSKYAEETHGLQDSIRFFDHSRNIYLLFDPVSKFTLFADQEM